MRTVLLIVLFYLLIRYRRGILALFLVLGGAFLSLLFFIPLMLQGRRRSQTLKREPDETVIDVEAREVSTPKKLRSAE